jgi:hypothetical protein
MKLHSVHVVPMIGLGFFDEVIEFPVDHNKIKIRTIIVLFFSITFYKEI